MLLKKYLCHIKIKKHLNRYFSNFNRINLIQFFFSEIQFKIDYCALYGTEKAVISHYLYGR